MLSHIATDLHQVYLEEVFTPQLGKPETSTPAKPKSSSDLDNDGDVDSFEKKVRQVVYDVRHIMKVEKVPAEKAFEMRSSKTNYSAEVIKTAKEKLGIKGGSVTSVSEEILSEDDKVGIVVNYKNGTTYRKSVSRDSVQTELQKFRTNPNVSSVERTGYGLAKRDYDGDGKVENPSKEHAGSVHNAIQKATGGVPDGKDTRGKTSKKKLKSYGVSEGFSNWREDLHEIVNADDEIESSNEKQIKEKIVDNYSGKKNKRVVNINPQFNESIENLGGHIVESFELNEEYLNEAVDIATEFFYNCGLNENGVDIVIEELGEQTFAEFVFELSEEYLLSEELKKSQSNVKTSRAPKGTKQYATTAKRVKTQGGTKMSTKDRIGSTIRKDRVKKAVEKAKETQAPSSEKSSEGQKKGIAGRLGSALGFVVKKGREDIKRVQDAAQTARDVASRRGAEAKAVYDAVRERGKNVEQSPQATRARRRATVAAGRAAQAAGKTAVKAAGAAGAAAGEGVKAHKQGKTGAQVAGRAAGTFVRKLTREELQLHEKAESEQQQKLFGLALSVKRGETPRSEASPEVLKIVNTMSEREIRKFAKTPHSEVPKKKVNEEISNPEGVSDRKSPIITQRQKHTVSIQINNKKRQYGIGEDVDSFATDNPILSTLNVRIARLKAQNDPNKAKQLATLITQQQRLELESSRKRLKTQQKPQVQNSSYEPEGELVDERTRYAKETGKHFRTGRPSVEGGDPRVKERNKPPIKHGGSRQEPKSGEKPPSPSEEAKKKGVLSPLEHKVALRRNARQRAADFRMPTTGT